MNSHIHAVINKYMNYGWNIDCGRYGCFVKASNAPYIQGLCESGNLRLFKKINITRIQIFNFAIRIAHKNKRDNILRYLKRLIIEYV